MNPKVFVSYSWNSQDNKQRVLALAERMVADGVEVMLDQWDCLEGQDKNAYMERMVSDDSVTTVLVLCEPQYTEKADARSSGVGTETLIISEHVYRNASQSKFIPLLWERDGADEPSLPVYLQSRIWLDFSSPELQNEHWEELIRRLYDKPLHQKPALGHPPAYILDDVGAPASPMTSKLEVLRQAVSQGRPRLIPYRNDFLDACVQYADAMRVRERPIAADFGKRVLDDCTKLRAARNCITDWVLLESGNDPDPEFVDSLIRLLERLLEVKVRPQELREWQDWWFEAETVFVYETFLYVVAALMRTSDCATLHTILTTHYILPEIIADQGAPLDTIRFFHGHSDALQQVLARPGTEKLSAAAECVKRLADRTDLPFTSVIEAEALVMLMVLLDPDMWWYPGTLFYAPISRPLQFFARAARHRNFQKLASITGVPSAQTLRESARQGLDRLSEVARNFSFHSTSLWLLMNMDALDSLD